MASRAQTSKGFPPSRAKFLSGMLLLPPRARIKPAMCIVDAQGRCIMYAWVGTALCSDGRMYLSEYNDVYIFYTAVVCFCCFALYKRGAGAVWK